MIDPIKAISDAVKNDPSWQTIGVLGDVIHDKHGTAWISNKQLERLMWGKRFYIKQAKEY